MSNDDATQVPVVLDGTYRRNLDEEWGLELNFVCVVRRDGWGQAATACLVAMVEIAVGTLKWDAVTGKVLFVQVQKPYEGRGVGRTLYEVGAIVAQEGGWTAPVHSDERTEQGDALARKLGAPPAKKIVKWTWPGLPPEPSASEGDESQTEAG